MAGEDAAVQHLGIGEYHIGVFADPRLFLRRCVTVVGASLQIRDAELRERSELIVGQRLGGIEDHRGAWPQRVEYRLRDRQLEAAGFA